MLPAIVVIIPVILMFRVAGLAGSYPGIIFLYTAFNLPFTIWMMKSFFDEFGQAIFNTNSWAQVLGENRPFLFDLLHRGENLEHGCKIASCARLLAQANESSAQ